MKKATTNNYDKIRNQISKMERAGFKIKTIILTLHAKGHSCPQIEPHFPHSDISGIIGNYIDSLVYKFRYEASKTIYIEMFDRLTPVIQMKQMTIFKQAA